MLKKNLKDKVQFLGDNMYNSNQLKKDLISGLITAVAIALSPLEAIADTVYAGKVKNAESPAYVVFDDIYIFHYIY